MEGNVFAIDYEGNRVYSNIPLDDVDHIDVKVLSGDEVLKIFTNEKDCVAHDACPDRWMDYFDAEYTVEASELEEWNKREDSYDWLWR